MANREKLTVQSELIAKLDQPALLLNREQIVFANKAAQNLLGRHIVGANVRLALRAPSAIATALSNQPARALVPRIGTPDSLWELCSQPLDDEARLITLQNVSAESSVARVHADFVANASHELRTPIANILGYAEALSDDGAGENPAMRSKFLNTIRREGERMQSVISDLMSLSRIEAGKHKLPDMKVNLARICNETIAEFSDSAKIETEITTENLEIYGDEGQLKQMLRNLIDNAVKYGGDGNIPSVTLELTEGGWTNLTVANAGAPIPAELIPRLTERFFRIDAGRSKAIGGTGLGLSIVKHIVIRHRGRMDIASESGTGTIISIRMPQA